MAYVTQPEQTSIFAEVVAFFARLGKSFQFAQQAQTRIATMERLYDKSDAELAAMGLKRENITHHVFKDLLLD
ncbi:MAG: hypothetical protein HKP40_03045 [Litoreibacter sp.]|nr:hypothetical protein [Litoreibacter sp.]